MTFDAGPPSYQPLHVPAIDLQTVLAQLLADLAAAVERPLQVQLINAPHQRQLLGARGHRLVAQPRAAAVKAIVEAHDGSACASSTPGRGSSFELTLPAVPPQQ
jgi:hypothetical protein